MLATQIEAEIQRTQVKLWEEKTKLIDGMRADGNQVELWLWGQDSHLDEL